MIKFGTGGWREIIGDQFTKHNIQLIAQGIADTMISDTIAIGYDRRFLSDEASRWISEVFAGNKIKVLLSPKATPTPMTMFIVKDLDLEFGIHITASHNPALYNGIKLVMKDGRDANTELVEALEKTINQINNIHSMKFDQALQKNLIEFRDPRNKYIDSIMDYVDNKTIRDANLKILVDPMHGVSKTSLSIILNSLRCDVDLINERQDTLFGGKLPAPSSANLAELQNKVREEVYDLGIATDGDADRVGIVDELGHYLHPNILMALLYHYLLKYKSETGAVVRNLSTSHLLDKIASEHNQDVIETEVGFRYISEAMEKYDALIGGESSGGLTIRGHIPGKDGIFAATLLVEMVSITGKKVSQLVKEVQERYGYYYNSESNYRLSKNKKEEIINLIFDKKSYPEQYSKIKRIITIDGLKLVFENDSWVSLRFSGTEPLMRIFSESYSKEDSDYLIQVMTDFLSL